MHLHVFRLFQPGRLLSATASVVLVMFLWLLIFPTVLAAQTPPAHQLPSSPSTSVSEEDAELPKLLAQIETTLQRFQGPLERGEEPRLDPAELAHFRQRLAHLDTRARQQFAQLAQHFQAKHLPEVIHQRHRDAVATYEAAVATLRQQLDALAAASTPQARRDKAVRVVQHLRATQPQGAKRAVDPNRLPFRTPDGKVRKAKEAKEDYETALTPPQSVMVATNGLLPGLLAAPVAALPATPTPDDLAPTEDVQLTDEIKALAAALGNNPVQIYNWVHDQIEFMPTYGSIQGAQMTLQTKRGNACDTASLLLALLRAAQIPARYVYGTVQIPIAQVMNWVGGVTVPEAALQLLGQGGIPHTGLVQGGVMTAVKLEHVWVDAWVDFFPSRGAVHRVGDTWIPMDASFKQYHYAPGMGLQEQMPFDAPALLAQATASAQINVADGWVSGLDHVLLQEKLSTYLNQLHTAVIAHKPTATADEVLGSKRILPARRPVLAAGLPYQLVVRGHLWAALPETLRHQFRLTLYATALDRLSDLPVFSFTHSLPALAGKPITLSFPPASQADAHLLASYLPQPPADGSPLDPRAFPTALPGYLMHLTAELRVDGVVVAHGGHFTMGQILVSTAGLYDPHTGWQEVENTPPIAGEYRAVALNSAGIAASQVQMLYDKLTATKTRLEAGQFTGITAEELTGNMLFSAVVSYFVANDITARLSASMAGVVEYRRPSFGSFRAKVQPHLLFGIPHTVSFPGLELDITHLESIVVHKANDRTAHVSYVLQSGLRQSALEHHIPERLFHTAQRPGEALSAVKALAVASRQGQRIYTILPENMAHALPQLMIAADVLVEIQTAVATGKHAVVSQHEVTVGDWTGVGYIIFDPETGAGAYQISGGANGAVFFFVGVTAGHILWYGILSILAALTASGGLLVPAISLLIGELAVLLAGFILLYKLAANPDDRGCFWSGVVTTLAAAGFPTLSVSLPYAKVVWAVATAIFVPINVTFPTNCLFGWSSPL